MTAAHCPRCQAPLTGTGGNTFCPRCTGRLWLGTAALPDDAEDLPARLPALRVGDYELGQELGRGAMGVVYRARQPRLRREVAVKVILASRFAGESARKRFLAEAELAAQLDHPNIVPIYEVGETPDGPFYAMKLVEGRTLAEQMQNDECKIKNQNSSSRTAPFLHSSFSLLHFCKIARAVHHAHQRGVLHRDLKPGNILIDAQGEPHITDFGLARQLGADSSLTLSGAPLGTPAYMSPEQARGEKGISTASDVWSLGAILFHLLTGRPPFIGPTATDVLLHVRTQEAPRLRSLNPRLPSDLETICLKCLEKDPPRRYRDAAALADDLERFLGHEPILARPATRWERAAKWVRRHPARAALIALSVSAPLVVLALVLRYNQSLQEKNDQVVATLLRQDWQHAEELFAEHKAADGLALLARMLRDQPGQRAVAERLLSALARQDFAVRAGPLLRTGGDAGCRFVAFSRDGHRIIGGNEHGLGLWDARTGARLAGAANELDHPNAAEHYVLSPDGRTAIVWMRHLVPPKVQLWDVPTARRLAEWEVAAELSGASFSADSQTLRFLHADGVESRDALLGRPPQLEAAELCAHNLTSTQWWVIGGPVAVTLSNKLTGAVWREAGRHGRLVLDSAFSPDERQLVTASMDRTAQVWDLRPARFAATVLRHCDLPVRAQFSPDGRSVLTMSATNGTVVWDAATGRRRVEITHGPITFDANFDPTGKWIVTAGSDYCARVWDAHTGREQGPALRHEFSSYQTGDESIYDARFTPDGRRIVTAGHGGTIQLWDAADHHSIVQRTERGAGFHYATVNRDGTRLIAAALRAAWLWDARTLTPLAQLTTNRTWVAATEFSRDGRWAAVGTDTSVTLYDAASGRPLGPPLLHESAVLPARFSPDGRWLVSGTENGGTRVWEVATGKNLATPAGHAARIFTADFSPDARRIVTASADHTARVWDARTGLPLGEPMVHPAEVRGAVFSPDGRWVLTSCADGAARIWETPVINGPVPMWLAEFAETIAGFRLDTTRSVELVFAADLDRLRRQIELLPSEDECAKWARWVLDDRPDKPGSPSAPNRTAPNVGAQ